MEVETIKKGKMILFLASIRCFRVLLVVDREIKM